MEEDPYFRQSLILLFDTVVDELGSEDDVSQELQRAVTTLHPGDLFTARLAFDALPQDQRERIRNHAGHKAVVYRNNHRLETFLAGDIDSQWEAWPLPADSQASPPASSPPASSPPASSPPSSPKPLFKSQPEPRTTQRARRIRPDDFLGPHRKR